MKDLFASAHPAVRKLAAQAKGELRQRKREEYARRYLQPRSSPSPTTSGRVKPNGP